MSSQPIHPSRLESLQGPYTESRVGHDDLGLFSHDEGCNCLLQIINRRYPLGWDRVLDGREVEVSGCEWRAFQGT